jgi:hypothetical protein
MRTRFLVLGVVLFLSVTLPCHGGFDSGSVQSAMPKANAATAFDSSMAATPPVTGQALVVKGTSRIRIRIAGVFVLGCPGIDLPLPLPTIKNSSNIPRPKR